MATEYLRGTSHYEKHHERAALTLEGYAEPLLEGASARRPRLANGAPRWLARYSKGHCPRRIAGVAWQPTRLPDETQGEKLANGYRGVIK